MITVLLRCDGDGCGAVLEPHADTAEQARQAAAAAGWSLDAETGHDLCGLHTLNRARARARAAHEDDQGLLI